MLEFQYQVSAWLSILHFCCIIISLSDLKTPRNFTTLFFLVKFGSKCHWKEKDVLKSSFQQDLLIYFVYCWIWLREGVFIAGYDLGKGCWYWHLDSCLQLMVSSHRNARQLGSSHCSHLEHAPNGLSEISHHEPLLLLCFLFAPSHSLIFCCLSKHDGAVFFRFTSGCVG